MVADINNDGPELIQYIHWTSEVDFNVQEILCYEYRRLKDVEILTPPSFFQTLNGPLLSTDCQMIDNGPV